MLWLKTDAAGCNGLRSPDERSDIRGLSPRLGFPDVASLIRATVLATGNVPLRGTSDTRDFAWAYGKAADIDCLASRRR